MSQLEQQMRHRDREMVPRFLVQGMFALMLASVAIVGYAKWADTPKLGVLSVTPVVESRNIFLTGDRNDRFVVTDEAGTVLAVSTEDKQGFIGVIGRVIERERHVKGTDLTHPVQVARREDGRIAIIDETTGRQIELIGYGRDNVAAFARLLD